VNSSLNSLNNSNNTGPRKKERLSKIDKVGETLDVSRIVLYVRGSKPAQHATQNGTRNNIL
jgi:hypothetical protein